MSWIKNIQEILGRFSLKRKQKRLQRRVKAMGLEKAKSIGVLYNATNRNEAERVRKFVRYLKEERKEVLSLGFVNSKDTSENITATAGYTYFDLTHLRKNAVPAGEQITAFINQPFSILIDLNLKADCFPLEYISSLSKATFKVGASGNYRNKACDLMIDVSKNNTLEFLIIQIKQYLKMIRN